MEYGLIGKKLGHSFSKAIHESIMDYEYILKELKEDELDSFMKKKEFKAINVTIPYKEEVIKYLDEKDESVLKIGACNVVVNNNGYLKGYNSDYFGLKALILKNNIIVENKKCLILGTGGTSKTAYWVLKDLKAKEIIFVSRSKKENCITYEEVYEESDVNIIINTTPKGMYPNNDEMILDISKFDKLEGVIDVIFNPLRTRLIQDARARGIKCEGGLYMLVAQAVKAIEYFKDIELDKEIIANIYSKILKEKENIVLIGMPGCGKSTIARALSREMIDVDEYISENYGRSPKEIIEEDGEEAFRKIESACIKKISMSSGLVIACGGGVILKEENMNHLKQNGLIVYIDRDLNKLAMGSNRPLSSNYASLKALYEKRKDLYTKYCDIRIENNNGIKEAIDKINEYICN